MLWDHNCSTLLFSLDFFNRTLWTRSMYFHVVSLSWSSCSADDHRNEWKWKILRSFDMAIRSLLDHLCPAREWSKRAQLFFCSPHHSSSESSSDRLVELWIQIKTIKIRLDRWETNSNFINELRTERVWYSPLQKMFWSSSQFHSADHIW